MDFITDLALIVSLVSFLCGLLITAISGSAKGAKIFLGILSALTIIALLIGLIVSGGLLVFLLFQLITLVLIIFFTIIAGAVAGGGIYKLIHKHSAFKQLKEEDLKDYLSLAEFATIEVIDKERAQGRIKSGYYDGGKYKNALFIHKSELSKIDH